MGKWNKILESLEFYRNILGTNGKITLSPAVQLLNIDQLDDIIKWWLDWCGGELNDRYGFTWLATVWYPLICNPNIAPRKWRLMVADKLSKHYKRIKKRSIYTREVSTVAESLYKIQR